MLLPIFQDIAIASSGATGTSEVVTFMPAFNPMANATNVDLSVVDMPQIFVELPTVIYSAAQKILPTVVGRLVLIFKAILKTAVLVGIDVHLDNTAVMACAHLQQLVKLALRFVVPSVSISKATCLIVVAVTMHVPSFLNKESLFARMVFVDFLLLAVHLA